MILSLCAQPCQNNDVNDYDCENEDENSKNNDENEENDDDGEESDDIEFACPALPRMRRGSGPWRRHVRRDGSHVMSSVMMMMIMIMLIIMMMSILIQVIFGMPTSFGGGVYG